GLDARRHPRRHEAGRRGHTHGYTAVLLAPPAPRSGPQPRPPPERGAPAPRPAVLLAPPAPRSGPQPRPPPERGAPAPRPAVLVAPSLTGTPPRWVGRWSRRGRAGGWRTGPPGRRRPSPGCRGRPGRPPDRCARRRAP